jgi:hypothetical protein
VVRKPEEKRPLRRSQHRWEDIRMNIREIGWGCVGLVHVSQDRDQYQVFVNTILNLQVP